jgi:signal transduction histidine kinase
MSENIAKHVFERFYRGAGMKEGGAGLGLAIAQALVEAHAGSLTLESRPEAGARFTVSLPAGVALPS